MLRKLLIFLIALMPVAAIAQVTDDGKPVKVITNADIIGTTLFSSDTVYNLSGFVYVEDGEVLVIEPGTVIKSNPGQAELATALVVARGGKLYAEGTALNPIVFTSISDDVDDPYDIPLPPSTAGRGLWGGVLMLGKATIADPAGENDIEGLPVAAINMYGGTDDNDNSGVLKYVSIRHGGSIIGAANEINGLTLGGVGRGTTIEHIEIFANVDDAIEFFGGTVNVKWAVCAFGGDDQIDYDEGWRGEAQFIFAINDTLDSDTYGEHDGAVSPEDQTPYATPLLSNVTAIGVGNASAAINAQCFNIRDNAGAGYFNSIFAYHKGVGVRIEDLTTGHDSRERLSVGDIRFQNNMFWNILGGLQNQTWVADSVFGVAAFNNREEDPILGCINYGTKDSLDPRPDPFGPAVGTWVNPATSYNPPANPGLHTGSTFFTAVDYVGAFDPNVAMDQQWVAGWSFLYTAGYFGDNRISSCCVTPRRGNVDELGVYPTDIDIADLVYLVDFMFAGGTAPACIDEANVDGNGAVGFEVDIADLVYLVDYMFAGGTEPVTCN